MNVKEIKSLIEEFHREFDKTKWCHDYWSLVIQTDEAWKVWKKLKPELLKILENVKVN